MKDVIWKSNNGNIVSFIALIALLLGACTIKEDKNVAPADQVVRNAVESDTVKAQPTVIAAHGTVKAIRSANVAFESALPIKKVCVKNGDFVKQGAPIALLDTYQMQNKIEQAARAVESARLEMLDVIISQGYDSQKMGEVPDRVKQLAEVKSGYRLKRTQLEAARHEAERGAVKAPFSGVVANLSHQVSNVSAVGETLCRIIDISQMKVEFKIMEQDLARVKKGTPVVAQPYSDPSATYYGTVSEINPVVDAQGSVIVKAILTGGEKLFDGMHVKLKIEN